MGENDVLDAEYRAFVRQLHAQTIGIVAEVDCWWMQVLYPELSSFTADPFDPQTPRRPAPTSQYTSDATGHRSPLRRAPSLPESKANNEDRAQRGDGSAVNHHSDQSCSCSRWSGSGSGCATFTSESGRHRWMWDRHAAFRHPDASGRLLGDGPSTELCAAVLVGHDDLGDRLAGRYVEDDEQRLQNY
jgi:hypothetical protein